VSCNKPNYGALRFSKSVITFDTVFTSLGSTTRHFIVHNPSSNDITTTIFLAGGKHSNYSINVNGMPGTTNNNSYFKDLTIPKRDSIFIFVKVNIDPRDQDNPFLITDSIVFLTGQRQQDVKLLAYGQDAHYIVAHPDTGYKIVAETHETVTWTKERPYVVFGWAVIDSLGTLDIEPGTRIFFHNNSGLWAYRYSNLKVKGTLDEPVLFRGDRLEPRFENDFAQWNRIWINEGANANIDYAIITNAFIGVQVDPLPNNENIIITPNSLVNIENTIIQNTKHCGILARFLNVNMTNCVIVNNGASSLQLEGGKYTMKHLTIANYFSQTERKVPACYVSNVVSGYYNFQDIPEAIDAEFINCIITGKVETEVFVNHKPNENAKLEVVFQNCLVKAKDHSNYFKDCLRNVDPKFVNIDKLDFKLQSTSPAIGKGVDTGVLYDILGNPRSNPPDIGAYQF
jgi:hypothetical protein